MASEAPYVKAIIEALNALDGVFVWRQQAGKVPVGRGWMQLAPKGACDIIGVVRAAQWFDGDSHVIGHVGRLLSIECKATKSGAAKDNGQGTVAAQHSWRVLMRGLGALHIDAAKRDDETMADAVERVVNAVIEARG